MALFVHTTVNTKEALINYVVRLHVVILQIESGGNWRFNHDTPKELASPIERPSNSPSVRKPCYIPGQDTSQRQPHLADILFLVLGHWSVDGRNPVLAFASPAPASQRGILAPLQPGLCGARQQKQQHATS
jgi:hypothetical protein